MRGLIILCTFLGLVAAGRLPGYQYNAQSSGGQLRHTYSPQPHAQYGVMPTSAAEVLKDLQTIMSVQSNNLGPNFELHTQPQQVSYSSQSLSVGNVGSAASAPGSLGQPQARYLTPVSAAVNTLQQQQQQYSQQQQQFQQQQQVQQAQQLVPQQQHIASQQPQFQQPQQVAIEQQQISQQFLAEQEQAQHLQQQQQQQVEPETVISKRFYLHAAPEDDEEELKERHVTVGRPRKNYNVVFIKSSDKATKKASIKITPAANEEKTVIYVLNKKQEAADIDAQVYEPITTTAKPEVYFIKYQTVEEAAHAQQTIQAQYDALGGSTQITNEGVAPVSSVIGSLEANKHAEAGADGALEVAHDSPTAQADEQQTGLSTGAQPQEQALGVQLPVAQNVNTNNGYLPPVRYYR